MNEILDHLRSGDKVKVFFTDQPPRDFSIFCISDGEIVLTEPVRVYASMRNFPGKQIIVAQSKVINGDKFSIGDKITVVTKSGKKLSMYINYFLGKDGLALSLKKAPSGGALKWLLRMMSNYM